MEFTYKTLASLIVSRLMLARSFELSGLFEAERVFGPQRVVMLLVMLANFEAFNVTATGLCIVYSVLLTRGSS